MGAANVFLTAQWRHLALVNFEIDPAALRPLVPAGVELDTWNDRALVSVVGFEFLDTRVRGVRVPFHRDFEEINVRFYVRRRDGDGWKRGVVFVREVVPRAAIAFVARAIYGEPYLTMPTRRSVRLDGPPDARHVRYEWRFRYRWNSLRLVPRGEAGPTTPGSEEEFITEHYWGYTRLRNGGTAEYRVEHPRWNVCAASDARIDIDVRELYGDRFVDALAAPPSSAFLADGSAVTVSRGSRI